MLCNAGVRGDDINGCVLTLVNVKPLVNRGMSNGWCVLNCVVLIVYFL